MHNVINRIIIAESPLFQKAGPSNNPFRQSCSLEHPEEQHNTFSDIPFGQSHSSSHGIDGQKYQTYGIGLQIAGSRVKGRTIA